MTLDLDDPDLFRHLLTEAPSPVLLTRDVTGLALREGRRRVRRRRIAGVAIGAGLSCLTAVAGAGVLDALDARTAANAAGELWALDSTEAGAVIARVDNATMVQPGLSSSIVTHEDGTTTVTDMTDWQVTWSSTRTPRTFDGSGAMTFSRQDAAPCVLARIENGELVLSSRRVGQSVRQLGRVPLARPVTGIVVHLAGGEGWLVLVVSRAGVTEGVLPEAHLRAADLWTALDGADSGDPRWGVESGGFRHRLAAMRLREGGEEHNPFDEVAVDVSQATNDPDVRYDDIPPDGSVVRTVAKTVLLEER